MLNATLTLNQKVAFQRSYLAQKTSLSWALACLLHRTAEARRVDWNPASRDKLMLLIVSNQKKTMTGQQLFKFLKEEY